MEDDNKKIEITQDFLEKHRNNTRKYMHLLSKNSENPSSIQETLNRIESKFGVSIKRSVSQEVPQEQVRKSDDESLQDFIKQIRAKYLPVNEPNTEVSVNQAKFEPLIDLSDHDKGKDKVQEGVDGQIIQEFVGLELEKEKSVYAGGRPKEFEGFKKNREDFYSFNKDLFKDKAQVLEEKPKIQNKSEDDNVLLLSDLVSDTPVPHFSPVHKPPRAKTYDEPHEAEKDESNRTFNENSMTMSFRRVHAEQLINSAISEVITSRLKIQKKPVSSSKVFSFEHFLNSGKVKFAPVKKVLHPDQGVRKPEVLQKLLLRKGQILKELEKLDKEKSEILMLMGKS